MTRDPSKEDVRVMATDELAETGIVQEVNRRFLHPLGLALLPVGNDTFHIVGAVRDEEGWVYDDSDLDPEKAKEVDDMLSEALERRKEGLGFGIQPVPDGE